MILNIFVSLLAVAGFALVLWWSKIVTVAQEAMRKTMGGLSAMFDSTLDDDAKEVAVRQAGLGLIVSAFHILWRIAACLAAAAAPIYLADLIGLTSSAEVFALMLRLDYIVIVSVVAIVLAEGLRRFNMRRARSEAGAQDETPSEEPNRYSAADRFFHVLAFAGPRVMKTTSALEDRLMARRLTDRAEAPIFITSLARGGTTAVLNALYDIPGVATHTYRDMPFLTAPLLWSRIAGRKRQVERHQRAHGDGLEIDLDSPEALEEVVWKLFWPEKYHADHIDLWTAADRDPAAEAFLGAHFGKIISARKAQTEAAFSGPWRYCSKNNANIARIPFLTEAFPDARIVVPLRRPECHALSLLRQHKNFSKVQAEDAFVKRYMRDIGHYEFGLIHAPLGFAGFEATAYDPQTPDYWLAYWLHSFRAVAEVQASCLFVPQDDLRSTPVETMTDLCTALSLDPAGVDFQAHFRPVPDEAPTDGFTPALLAEATDVYHALAEKTPQQILQTR